MSFPSLTGTTETLTAVSVASTPFASSFPTATLAEKQGNGSAYLFYANTSSAQVTRGYAAGNIQIVYSNPEEMLHFPLVLEILILIIFLQPLTVAALIILVEEVPL